MEPSLKTDRPLLESIQSRVPLVREPFAALASQLGWSEQAVLDRLAALRAPGGVIREIAGIFDVVRLGYRQSLVAFGVPPQRLDTAGAAVARHPGVSHCYGRQGAYNLWFTVAVSPTSTLGLDRTVRALAEEAGASARMILPMLRRYKLDVRFTGGDGRGEADPRPAEPAAPRAPPGPMPTEEQLEAIRALQTDLPLCRDPFAVLAGQAGLEADGLLAHAADFLATGWMRRYAAVLHHRAAGAKANVMVVWRVGEDQADAAGAQCAESPGVSHCYLRPTCPDWAYGLYTMVHGATSEACLAAIEELAKATGLRDHLELWTMREYRKRRVKLFTPDERQWEASR